MTHVDTLGPNGAMSSSNCMNMGGGMATCNTMDMGHPQKGGSTLNIIGDLVARSQERSFRKKVGQMLSAGDCNGAANFALANERLDESTEIRRSCQPKPAETEPETITVEQFLAGMALAPPPTSDPAKPPATESNRQSSAIHSEGLLVERTVARQPVAHTSRSTPATAHTFKFDLFCIDEVIYLNKKVTKDWPLSNRTIRVDLNLERYCDGKCIQTARLSSVNATELYVKVDKLDDGRDLEVFLINRESGKFWDIVGPDSDMELKTTGTCQRRPFSGFPPTQF